MLKEGYNFLRYDADEAINCGVLQLLCEVRLQEGGDNCIILKLFELIGGSQFCEGNAELVG